MSGVKQKVLTENIIDKVVHEVEKKVSEIEIDKIVKKTVDELISKFQFEKDLSSGEVDKKHSRKNQKNILI